MGLFNDLAEMLVNGQQLTINVRKEGDGLVVSTMPVISGVKDKAVENIVPIVMNGTPDEFNDGFIDALRNGLPKAAGLVANIKEYEDGLEAARKNSEMAKKAKEERDKAKKEFDGYIELARQNLKEEKFLDAKKCLDKAAAVKDADKVLIDKARKAVDERSGAGGLFAGPVDKSDGKNITLGKDFKVPTRTEGSKAQPSAPAAEEPKPADASDAFEQAMALADEDETENENDDENMEE